MHFFYIGFGGGTCSTVCHCSLFNLYKGLKPTCCGFTGHYVPDGQMQQLPTGNHTVKTTKGTIGNYTTQTRSSPDT